MTALTGIRWYQVDVRGKCSFKCDVCGAMAEGGRVQYAPGVKVEYTGYSLGQMLGEMRGSAHAMPVGWSSHHANPQDIHKCPECNKP